MIVRCAKVKRVKNIVWAKFNYLAEFAFRIFTIEENIGGCESDCSGVIGHPSPQFTRILV